MLAAVVAVAVQVPITAVAWSSPAATCAAASSSRIALVVQHGDGSTVTRCIAFSGSSLTGEEVLAQSGLEFKTVSFGSLSAGVCQVDNEPATFPPTCWTGTSKFWALFVSRKGGAWAPSSLGVSTQVFHDGDAEGLRYESQTVISVPTVKGSCPSPTPPPAATATPRPTPTPTPTPRPTGSPTAGPTPPATAVPSARPGTTTAPEPAASASPPASTLLDGQVAGLAGSPGPSTGVAPTGSTNPPPADDPGSPALPIAVLAIVGLAGLAAIRRPAGRRSR